MKTNTTITAARVEYLKASAPDQKIVNIPGPRGGRNLQAGGTPSAGWTRACHLAGIRSVPIWSGHLPTPSRGFSPAVIDAIAAAPENLR